MADLTSYVLEDLSVGMAETLERTVTAADIEAFAEVSGDINPLYLDDAYAKTTRFGERIAHGMLSAGFISAVLGTRLPGPGSIYMSQNLRFMAPVKIGDTVTTKVEVSAIEAAKNRVSFATTCSVGDTVVVQGDALIMVPSRA